MIEHGSTHARLWELGRLYGVELEYTDVQGRRHPAQPEPLLAVLQALGAPVAGWGDVPAALRERRQTLWQRGCPPVTVIWTGARGGTGRAMRKYASGGLSGGMHRPGGGDGAAPPGVTGAVTLRLLAAVGGTHAHCRLQEETGAERHWRTHLADCPVSETATVEGAEYVARALPVPAGLPPGYHRLTVTVAGAHWTTLLMVAPRSAFAPSGTARRTWGVFLPLYALNSEHSWGAGDLADLSELVAWTRSRGGGVVGTLPLLAGFMGDELHNPSPYAPVSRLFWNEFYLDVKGLPELATCPAARELLAAPAFRAELAALQDSRLVDYRRVMTAKRRVLELLAGSLSPETPGRAGALAAWAEAHPAARDYARFRAVTERQRSGWPCWPERLRAGALQEGDSDPQSEQYHLYVQWALAEQIATVAGRSRHGGPGLYLDLPLGVHRDGYDTWRERAAFALAASGGAAPDPGFPQGQDWGFPPLHPEGLRNQGYRYFIAGLRQQLPHAGVLRIDHVMGLHRLFWIPNGFCARDGVYVRYPATELYAILALESRRHRTLLVGEDLGTVPRPVRAAMRRHQVQRMYVLPFELTGRPESGLNPVPPGSLATLNTHDLPPFAAFWRGAERQETPGGPGLAEGGLGLGDDARARAALAEYLHHRGHLSRPDPDTGGALLGCLRHLAASPAGLLLVNLEDLWLEPAPQNVPNSGPNRPNWQRKARYGLAALKRLPGMDEFLDELNNLRR